MNGRLRQRRVAPQFGLVDELTEPQRGGAHQAPEVRQRGDGGERLQVAFEIGGQVAVEPHRPLAGGLHAQGRHRKAAAAGQVAPIVRLAGLRGHQIAPLRLRRCQQLFPDAAAAESPQLAPRHRPQGEVARAAGERLRHPAHEEQVRRAAEQELPRPAAAVDGPLDGQQQIGSALHLVQGDWFGAAHQRLRVAPRRVQHVQVVQRPEPPPARREVLRQRALADLPRPGHHHRGHHVQAVAQAAGDVPGKRIGIHAVNDYAGRQAGQVLTGTPFRRRLLRSSFPDGYSCRDWLLSTGTIFAGATRTRKLIWNSLP